MELTGKTPTNAELIAFGMGDYSLRGLELDPLPGVLGTQVGTKAASWCCTLTSFDACRPMVKAIRDNADEADRDARLRFMAIFAKKIKLEPISDNPNRVVKKKPKLQAQVELDDDAASLI